MVSRLNLTFRWLLLISALAVLLTISLVFALNYEFKPKNSLYVETRSPVIQPLGLQGLSSLVMPANAHICVFAYCDDGFVNASVTITGPDPPIPLFEDVVAINSTTLNGTTSADLQSPLEFQVLPGIYYVVGTYGSASPKIAIVNATASGTYGEVVLNFGSSSPPPLGHIIISAWYWGESSGSFVQASAAITGPQSLNCTIGDDYLDASIFTMKTGAYSVVGTYGSAPSQNATVSVTAGTFIWLILDFSPSSFGLP